MTRAVIRENKSFKGHLVLIHQLAFPDIFYWFSFQQSIGGWGSRLPVIQCFRGLIQSLFLLALLIESRFYPRLPCKKI